jgi:hypothetical protein
MWPKTSLSCMIECTENVQVASSLQFSSVYKHGDIKAHMKNTYNCNNYASAHKWMIKFLKCKCNPLWHCEQFLNCLTVRSGFHCSLHVLPCQNGKILPTFLRNLLEVQYHSTKFLHVHSSHLTSFSDFITLQVLISILSPNLSWDIIILTAIIWCFKLNTLYNT